LIQSGIPCFQIDAESAGILPSGLGFHPSLQNETGPDGKNGFRVDPRRSVFISIIGGEEKMVDGRKRGKRRKGDCDSVAFFLRGLKSHDGTGQSIEQRANIAPFPGISHPALLPEGEETPPSHRAGENDRPGDSILPNDGSRGAENDGSRGAENEGGEENDGGEKDGLGEKLSMGV